MTENKTKQTTQDVIDYINTYPNPKVIPDCLKLLEIFKSITKCEPVKWAHMIGYDSYHYKYESGREGDSFITGFAPSKVGITIYAYCDYVGLEEDLKSFGKYKKGASCLYIKSLADIDITVLKKIITNCIQWSKKTYPKNK